MTHEDLIQEIAQRLNWTKEKVSESLSATVDILNENISEGNVVSVVNFGMFDTIKTNEHICHDIETDERTLIPPKIEVIFKPSSAIKSNFQKNQND